MNATLLALIICIAAAGLEGALAGGGVRQRLAELRMPLYSPPFALWLVIGAGAFVSVGACATGILITPNDGGADVTVVDASGCPQYDLTQSASIIDGSIASVPSIGPSLDLITPEPMSLSHVAVGAAAFVRRRHK